MFSDQQRPSLPELIDPVPQLDGLVPRKSTRVQATVRRLALFSVALLTATSTFLADIATPTPAQAAATTSAPYWIANPQGAVWNFGSAGSYGDLSGKALNKPIVGIAPTPTNKGYWLVASDGGIFSFGDAKFYGSTGAIKLNKPIVGMAPTPTNKGYWMVASDGGIFAFGDAAFFGSTGAIKLNQPIVAMAATPTNKGYWMVASDGGIFAFGDAAFFGSTGAIKLNRPIVSMTATPTNKGYWLAASDGGIFAFGDAKFYGSPGGGSDTSYSRIVSAPDGKGYWLIRNGGDAMAYGSADPVTAADDTTTTTTDPEDSYDAAITKRPAVGLIYTINGPGDLALDYAMRQRNKPYTWGGNGPDSFDCSGLTLQAWKLGGVNLPRVANDQYEAGRKVPLAQAIPGDLVFWADNVSDPRSIYHVAVYIGAGNVVMAPKTGDVVRSSAIWTTGLMPFAVRPRG